MAFSRTWDTAYEAIPADTDQAKEGALRIRNLKVDIKERAEIDHEHTDDTKGGFHKKVTLPNLGSDPVFIASTGIAYTKDVDGITELFYVDSGGTVVQITTVGALKEASIIPPRNHISGLVLSNAAVPNTDITVGIGEAADSTRVNLLERATAITKQIDNPWVPGNDLGGFPTALTLTANTTYHLFLLRKTSDGTTDVGFDDVLNASNLLADATDYGKFRRVGSALTDGSSNIKAFVSAEMGGGVEYEWLNQAADDVNTTSEAAQNPTTNVPLGISVLGRYGVTIDSAGALGNSRAFIRLSSGLLSAGLAASNNLRATAAAGTTSFAVPGGAMNSVITNTSRRIFTDMLKVGAGTYRYHVWTRGYNDPRIT